MVIQNTKQHRGMAMEFLFWNKLDVSLVIFSVKYKDTNGNSRQKKKQERTTELINNDLCSQCAMRKIRPNN